MCGLLRSLIPFAIAMSVVAGAAAEDLEKAIARCAAIEGDLERLECYDALAQSLGLDGPQPVSSDVDDAGKWIVKVEQNPIDDSRTVVLALQADSGESSWGKPIVIVLRCQSGKTELYINWNDYLGSEAEVLCRVGKAKAETRKWSLSTDSQATFYPGAAVSFIRRLLLVNQLVCQVTPYGEGPTTAVFDLKGLGNAIAPLKETCGWD